MERTQKVKECSNKKKNNKKRKPSETVKDVIFLKKTRTLEKSHLLKET